MNPRENLLLFLKEWRRHTVAETAGIRSQNWVSVKECQLAKERLQSLLVDAEDVVPVSATERDLVRDLIAMEADNHLLLENQRAELKTRERELDESSRNLKRVRGSYVRMDTLRWQSYS